MDLVQYSQGGHSVHGFAPNIESDSISISPGSFIGSISDVSSDSTQALSSARGPLSTQPENLADNNRVPRQGSGSRPSRPTPSQWVCEYGCKGKGETFGRKPDRDRHYKNKHPVEPLTHYHCPRDGCGYHGTRKDKFSEHMRKVHKDSDYKPCRTRGLPGMLPS
ncbi:MAG: hypothetical protein M1834_008047 [Cirrosporium novae-zelandiae]|nr:MAG: hypothetical protein M1834_008047 [Cirrosporium novae-zelandiae]